MHNICMKHGERGSSDALRSKLLREQKELEEWVKKEISNKAKKAESTFSKLVSRRKREMADIESKITKEISVITKKQARRIAKFKKSLDKLNSYYKKISHESFQSQIKGFQEKIGKNLRRTG
ncbi:hypothetical protein PAEPH01_0877 [Pancytospora epiphaga]|nr:hypothetical protein PAEPH01_0877 [Pancytospora epiphaga]